MEEGLGPCVVAAVGELSQEGGRFVIVTGSLYNVPLILAIIYAPNWDDVSFIKKNLNQFLQFDYT